MSTVPLPKAGWRAAWVSAWKEKPFRRKCIFLLLYVPAFVLFLNPFFVYIQQRKGAVLYDPLLHELPAADVSAFLFPLIYLSIIVAVISLMKAPHRLLRLVAAAALVYTLRTLTIGLIPLDPPAGCIPLRDPLVKHLAYNSVVITKDLFFSGHTSIMLLLCLSAIRKGLKWLFGACLALVIILLLIQHIHYTIDILGAFIFAWACWRISGRGTKIKPGA
jgi:membrane-associated phospholipid phosphatase